MSRKFKKKCEDEQVMVGFLKPTVASQRRCHKHSTHSVLPLNNNRLKKKTEKKKIRSVSVFLNTGAGKSNTSFSRNDTSSIPSAVEMYAGEPIKQKSTFKEKKNCHSDLCEAKKLCKELKDQIDDLKLQQSAYERQMKSYNSFEYSDFMPNRLFQPNYLNTCTSNENLGPNNPTNTPIPAVPDELQANRKVAPLQDSSNIPDSFSTSNNMVYDANSFDCIIKKLHSEREHYKRKVVKLQQELKLIKKSKNAFIRSPEVALNELTFYNADMIGEGRSAVVYEGTLHGKPVAVKKLIRSGVMTSSDRSYLAAEASLLLPLQHCNIVAVIGISSSPIEPLIITEFINGKTLADMLSKSGGSLDSATFFSVARDTAIGMAYLHSQKPPVLHLNLRPSNILVDSLLKAKVGDFGFSKIRIDAGISTSSNLAYLAPELLKFPAQITIKTDVYAFAILMWEMSTGRDPMAKRTTSQILDMMENNQRLRIRSDLPFAVQKLIGLCWEPLSAHRPSFKEIIIDFETMNLPEEWILKLKEIGVTRTDMSDMGSSYQDTSSITSSITPRKLKSADLIKGKKKRTSDRNEKASHPHRSYGQNSEKKFDKLKYRSSSSPVENDRSKSNEQAARSTVRAGPTTPLDFAPNPTPISKLRYVPHDLQSEINTPEIIPHKPNLLPNGFSFSKSRPRATCSTYPGDQPADSEEPSDFPRQVWSGEPFANPTRVEAPSRFDSKFRDFVSDACQAESTYKAHSGSYRKWSSLGLNPTSQKCKSLLSSENIQVRSVSAGTSSSNNSSLDTAIQVPGCYQSSNKNCASNLYSRPPHPFKTSPLGNSDRNHYRLQSELNKSNVILDNARRLLSCSPLHHTRSSSTHQDSFVPSFSTAKVIPDYVPRHSDHRRLTQQRGYVPSESSKSDISAESFLPLPAKLLNHQCLLSVGDSPRMRPEASTPGNDASLSSHANKIASILRNQTQTASDADETKSDKVTRILAQTAEELSNASCMLYSATEELRKQKLSSSL